MLTVLEWIRKNAYECCLVLITLIASFLLLFNLGDQYLWQDEANTALVAGSINNCGLPLIGDCRNVFIQDGITGFTARPRWLPANINNECCRAPLWRFHPWGMFYLTALSFKVFGPGTFSARFPFALFGIGTIVLTFFTALRLFNSRRLAVTAAALLLICVPFLVLAKQCRYYSPAAFFFLLSLFGYLGMLAGRKYSAFVYIISLLGLFHFNYVYIPAAIAAYGLHSFIYKKEKMPGVIAASVFAIALCLPFYLIFYKTDFYVFQNKSGTKGAVDALSAAVNYLIPVFKYVFNPMLIAGAFFYAYKHKNTGKQPLNAVEAGDNRGTWPLLLMSILIVLLSLIFLGHTVYFRYLAPVLPHIIILAALIMERVYSASKLAGVFLFLFIVFTGNIEKYVYEILNEYNGPDKGISKFLNIRADKQDVVYMAGFGDLPVKFYTGLKVAGGESLQEKYLLKSAKWIIIRRSTPPGLAGYAAKQYALENIDPAKYTAYEVQYPDMIAENRESPDEHRFWPDKNAPNLLILKKR